MDWLRQRDGRGFGLLCLYHGRSEHHLEALDKRGRHLLDGRLLAPTQHLLPLYDVLFLLSLSPLSV